MPLVSRLYVGDKLTIGVADGSALIIVGLWASCGSANLIFSSFYLRLSNTKSISVPQRKSTDIIESPSFETDEISLTPVTVPIVNSNSSVTSFL